MGSHLAILFKAKSLGRGEILGGRGCTREYYKRRVAIRRRAKKFMPWNYTLFRIEKDGLRAVPTPGQCAEIMAIFHEYIGHWDKEPTMKFVKDRFWWPGVHCGAVGYVSS